MATTKIWDVSYSLKEVIDYASNPNKTTRLDNEMEDELGNVLAYTTQEDKTAKQLYVSGINCSYSTALQEMTATKVRFNKQGGIVAYHGEQSFKPGEVTPDMAHKIGVELANRLWGDRFEVIVTTHLDKKHLHNHFVINSVSFKDGLRYYDNKKTYAEMRKQSDLLCKKYKLSVIDEPQGKGWHYAEWKANQDGKYTMRDLIRLDVDEAIDKSRTYTQFINELKKMGYTVKADRKHIAVIPKGSKKPIRLRSLTRDGAYTEESIKERILLNTKVHLEPFHKGTVKKYYYKGNLNKAKKITGFRALYFKYMYMMGILPKSAPNHKRVHFLLKEDLRYMDKITQEVTALCKNKIDTLEDLESRISKLQSKKEELIKERKSYYGKINRCKSKKDEARKEMLQKDANVITEEIKAITKEVRIYEGIKDRSISMKDKLNIVIQDERKGREQDECRWRNSGSSREDEPSRN